MKALLDGRCLGLDFETTGVQVESDRIVTACAAIVESGRVVFERQWLIAVDVDIPEAASEIHGIRTEFARENGVPATEGVKEIANAVAYAVHSGYPVVAYKADFDLTILDREVRRWEGQSLEDFCGREVAPVIDPLCIDKATDRYRPGKRKLETACEFFGVELDDAHNAAADAVAAVGVAYRLAERSLMDAAVLLDLYSDRPYRRSFVRDFGAMGRMSFAELHAKQVGWYAAQAESLGAYWRKSANQCRHEAGLIREDPGSSAEAICAAEVLEQEAAELDARVASLSSEWPVRAFEVA